MQNISKEYLLLFNTITDMVWALERLQADLCRAQRQAEDLCLREQEDDQPALKIPS